MFNNYKIVVTTAAGRRRYMQLLVTYIISCPIVDRYDIWINTNNNADIAFFKKLAEQYNVINLVWQPEGVLNGNASINSFYRGCVDEDTIYFKVDDDIIWMEPGLIESMVRFRIENPQFFLVSPLVINNSLSTYLLQIEDKLKLDTYYQSSASHPLLWGSGDFACELHKWFLNGYLKTRRWAELHLGRKEMGMTRFSINAILWFGRDLAKINGIVPGDDEEYLSCIYPSFLGKSNAWNGDTIASHFAFFTQRDILDRANILEAYGDTCRKLWEEDDAMSSIDKDIQSIIGDIDKDAEYYLTMPVPYKTVAQEKSKKDNFLRILPKPVVSLLVLLKRLFIDGGRSGQFSHIIPLDKP